MRAVEPDGAERATAGGKRSKRGRSSTPAHRGVRRAARCRGTRRDTEEHPVRLCAGARAAVAVDRSRRRARPRARGGRRARRRVSAHRSLPPSARRMADGVPLGYRGEYPEHPSALHSGRSAMHAKCDAHGAARDVRNVLRAGPQPSPMQSHPLGCNGLMHRRGIRSDPILSDLIRSDPIRSDLTIGRFDSDGPTRRCAAGPSAHMACARTSRSATPTRASDRRSCRCAP